jgi:hypothetical protein
MFVLGSLRKGIARAGKCCLEPVSRCTDGKSTPARLSGKGIQRDAKKMGAK